MNGDLVHQKVLCVYECCHKASWLHHNTLYLSRLLICVNLFYILSSPVIPSSTYININMPAHEYSLKMLFEITQN